MRNERGHATMAILTGILALSLTACGATGTGDNATVHAETQPAGKTEWEPGFGKTNQFLTKTEERLFEQAIGAKGDDRTSVEPVAFLAERVDGNGRIDMCSFLTRSEETDGSVSWEVMTARLAGGDKGGTSKSSVPLDAARIRATGIWEGISALAGEGWRQHPEDAGTRPKADDEHQTAVDSALMGFLVGENVLFGPIATKEKDDGIDLMYLVENLGPSDAGMNPIWLFVRFHEGRDGHVEVVDGACMDLAGYLRH